MKINRRSLITASAAAGALTFLPSVPVSAAIKADSVATLIDLTRCDGCPDHKIPLCVSSCREGRKSAFPNPPQQALRDYWPQKKHEDWSAKRHLFNRFTPYNWMFVQQVEISGKTISIPRRCMHCDNPPCAKLCPFGVKHKTAEGPVYIDHALCFGGAKCRSVCPWSVPQRQAGVGIYTLWQKYLPVGGGVMYKCDLCRDRLGAGEQPFCIEACPRKAMQIGRRDNILKQAEQLREQYDGDLYGMTENGGTSTIYVSAVAFSDIDAALVKQSKSRKTGQPVRLDQPENILAKQKSWALLSVIAPLAGVIAALGLTRGKPAEEDSPS